MPLPGLGSGNDKSNPNVALTEAVGMEQWQSGMGPDYVPYVSKDVYGRHIDQPDLSNPTRSRFERPLDTIRSFEAAAYGKELGSGGSSEVGADTPRNASRMSVQGYTNSAAHSRRESMQRSGSGYSAAAGPQYAYGPSGSVVGEEEDMYNGAHWDARHSTGPAGRQVNPYGSPVSDNGQVQQQIRLPVAQKLNYQTPPTPPQENAKKDKKSLFKKRLSFGKSKQ